MDYNRQGQQYAHYPQYQHSQPHHYQNSYPYPPQYYQHHPQHPPIAPSQIPVPPQIPPYAPSLPPAHHVQNGPVNTSMPFYQGNQQPLRTRPSGPPPTSASQSRPIVTLPETQVHPAPSHPASAGPQSSNQNMPSSSAKYFHQYFTPAEIQYLSEKQRGKMSYKDEDKIRQSACSFIESVGARIGFPRRTIATGQSLYHRFHLFHPIKDFMYCDVALAALFVSTKMHDTLKKPRELLAVSYALRYPEMLGRSRNPTGTVDLDNVDPQMVEKDRQRLLAIERLILETTCFNFTSRMPFPYVIKLGKQFKASKKLTKLAWRVAIDSYRTYMPLVYPPQSLALGSIYVAALLLSIDEHQPPPQTPAPAQPQSAQASSSSHPPPQPQPPEPSTSTQPQTDTSENPSQPSDPPPAEANQDTSSAEEITPGDLARLLNERLDWEDTYQTRVEDLEDFAHTLLDLVHSHTINPSANTSPSTPSSPSPHLSKSTNSLRGTAGAGSSSAGGDPYPYKADALLNLKIAMRQREHVPRSRRELGDDLVDEFGQPGSTVPPLSATPLATATGATFGTVGVPPSSGSGKESKLSHEKAARQDETTIRYLFFPPGYDADGDVVMGNAENVQR